MYICKFIGVYVYVYIYVCINMYMYIYVGYIYTYIGLCQTKFPALFLHRLQTAVMITFPARFCDSCPSVTSVASGSFCQQLILRPSILVPIQSQLSKETNMKFWSQAEDHSWACRMYLLKI